MLKLNFGKKYNGELKFKGIMVQFGLKIIKMNGNFQVMKISSIEIKILVKAGTENNL